MSRSCTICGKIPAPYLLPCQLTEQEKADNKAWADSLKEHFHTGHCPHLELPAYGCEEHAPFKEGDRVRVIVPDAPFKEGVILKACSDKERYWVRTEGGTTLNWTVYELEPQEPLWPLRFERQEPV